MVTPAAVMCAILRSYLSAEQTASALERFELELVRRGLCVCDDTGNVFLRGSPTKSLAAYYRDDPSKILCEIMGSFVTLEQAASATERFEAECEVRQWPMSVSR